MKKTKFSIIIPVYNTEKYLKRCFDSVINQTYNDYEVIVINDGSTDNSMDVIKEYPDFKVINQKNQGLSEARNNGIKVSEGDYLIFLDSDDYIHEKLLETLNKKLKKEDVVRYQAATFSDSKTEIHESLEKEFSSLKGPLAFKNITMCNFIEPAWLYAIKREYWNNSKFSFPKNRFHEDFGVIPEVIFKAKKVSSINFVGYYYYQRKNSIMNNLDYEKERKKCFDVLDIGLIELENISKTNVTLQEKSEFNHFIITSILQKGKSLNKEDKKNYRKIIHSKKLPDLLLDDTIKRKIKKIYYQIKY